MYMNEFSSGFLERTNRFPVAVSFKICKSFTKEPGVPLSRILSFNVQFKGVVCLAEGLLYVIFGLLDDNNEYAAGNGKVAVPKLSAPVPLDGKVLLKSQ